MFFQKLKEINLGTLGFILFMLPFIAMGVFFLWYGVINTISSFQSNTWPNVQGVITQSSVTYGGDVYRAEICYEFSVDSVLYSGSKISMQDYHSSERALADEIAARFPEGMAVAVYYKSENPDNCILEPGFQISSVAIIMAGLVFILLPLRIIAINLTESSPQPDDIPRLKGTESYKTGEIESCFASSPSKLAHKVKRDMVITFSMTIILIIASKLTQNKIITIASYASFALIFISFLVRLIMFSCKNNSLVCPLCNRPLEDEENKPNTLLCHYCHIIYSPESEG